MADIQLNSVTLATESGGTVVLDSAVQDNVTRLGTVTTGTMNNTIGSSATFPAGHVIGVKTQGTGGSFSGNSTSWAVISHKEITYQVKSQTSKILINWPIHIQLTHAEDVKRVGVAIRHSLDSYASELNNDDGSVLHMVSQGTGAGWHQWVSTVSAYHDHNQSVDTTITYKMYYVCQLGDTLYSWDGWGETFGTNEMATMMEVQG